MSKSVLLIGGNSGIGLSTSKLLLQQGHNITAASRSSDQLSQLGIATQAFDAQNPSPLQLPEVIDALVYFPGTITLKPFHRLTPADFLRDYQINVLGAVHCIQQALPALKKSPSASIVLFSTIASHQGMSFHASIASAKSALEGLTISLAAELAPNIRVNAIAPSLTNTPLASPLLGNDAKIEAAEKRHPLQSIGNPDHIAQLISFLISDHSSFITGQIHRPDGGLSSIRTF